MESLNINPPARPVLQPWLANPYRLISWYDMNKFSAGLFVNIGSSLQWFSTLVEKGQWNESTRESGEHFGENVAKDLRKIGCEVAARAAARFGHELPDEAGKIRRLSDIAPRARELQDVIFDEMRMQLFFWVPADRARYYDYPEDRDKWDDTQRSIEGAIRTHFSKAATEINSARECYALARWTPCVFHLMRACEVGIKAIYKSLNSPMPKLVDSWGNLLKPMDAQLRLNAPDRYGDWATHPDFFDHATNDVRAIKRAWRDTTMHIESDYDENGALKALNAVTSFFEHLSTKLDDAGKVHP